MPVRQHGLSRTKAYQVYQDMIHRCYRKANADYKWYGARGIKVCHRWRISFENFLADMGQPPEGQTLERKDNEKNYSPDNCEWASQSQNSRNRRSSVMITHGGRTQCLLSWAEELGLPVSMLYHRWHRGLPSGDILSANRQKPGPKRKINV